MRQVAYQWLQTSSVCTTASDPQHDKHADDNKCYQSGQCHHVVRLIHEQSLLRLEQLSGSGERLRQITDDIVRVFNTHAEPNHTRGHTGFGLFSLTHLTVRGGSGVAGQ